jgi:predicted O-methyltransferase YrrM
MADTPSEVDAYLVAALVGSDPEGDATEAAAAAAGLPSIAVSPVQGKLLGLIARAAGARRILEIGTLGGYSALWLARALPEGGRLVTLELDPRHAAVARASLDQAGVGERCDVRVGPARDSLAGLIESGDDFDLIFIDADKPSNPDYFASALRLSHPGTVIIVDNVIRQGRVVDGFDPDPAVAGTRALFELVASLEGVSATAIQTVGAKGHDGFLFALVDRPPGV